MTFHLYAQISDKSLKDRVPQRGLIGEEYNFTKDFYDKVRLCY